MNVKYLAYCLTILLVTIYFLSCTKKDDRNYTVKIINAIEIISNETTPSDSNFKYILKEPIIINKNNLTSNDSLRLINQFDNVVIDKDENIIVLDQKSSYLHKFDKKGNHKKIFGGKGQGPGEIEYPIALFVLNTEIIVTSSSYKVVFDFDGNYIKNETIKSDFPNNIYMLNDSKFVGENTKVEVHMRENRASAKIKTKIILYDESFQEIKKLRDKEAETDNLGSIGTEMKKVSNILTGNKNISYIVENSINSYIILCYNSEGNLFRKIKKRFIKVEDKIDKKNIQMVADGEIVKVLKKDNSAIEAKYKLAISELYIDKYGNLIALSSSRNDNGKKYYDIFKDGKFINRVNLFEDSELEVKFIKDKIVAIDSKNNRMLIYDYETKK